MPASSRKRNKGKERKAKQQAKKEEDNRAYAHNFWRRYCGKSTCNHGCDVIISDDHPVSNFMDQFWVNLDLRKYVEQNMRDLFVTHPQIWDNKSYMKIAIGILIRIGTNMLLGNGADISFPVCIGQSIMFFEEYEKLCDYDLVSDGRRKAMKWRDFHLSGSCNNSSRRDALKFYRKRTSCKCLKKMHLEARRTEPKMGNCMYCNKQEERVVLSVCSRCMVQQYCSKECQVADWLHHERACDNYRRVHLQIAEQTNE